MSHRHLTAAGIRFGYQRGQDVLHGACLDVAPGSRVALLGANGSGKSTLLQCLSGILAPAAGEICIDGHPLRQTRRGLREHRQRVQLVFQDPDDQLFSANVREDIAYGPMNLGLSRAEIDERVDRACALLAITALQDRPTHQLSFGQRKRVAIAGAIAMRPCVLLLDEPTAGVDPAGVDELFATLAGLEREGTTVVLSTHDTALALEWADSVAVIERGRVRQGRPVEVLADEPLLARARLRMPWLMALARELIGDGVLPAGASPSTTGQLRDALRGSLVGVVDAHPQPASSLD
ncbi:energy-coupling factor ABC transporter ATP-binding protein [Mycolicibacterium palauense]|uniref:energy-coupling factor ABC transporter ATP-binding protein n=1 Tax=Mycolicibacterium palauense TaxID=2034511 RepID=UPI000BFEE0BD|nr:ABC transporter ATP-binding protein [Mycolicibacterium palauense]